MLRYLGLGAISKVMLLFAVIILTGIWVGAWQLIAYDYDRSVEESSKETMNLAKAFEEHVRRLIVDVDQDLLRLKRIYEQDGLSVAVQAFESMDDSNRNLVAIYNEQGIVVASYIQEASGFDHSDREYFQAHKDNPSRNLFIGKPIIGRISGQITIPITRRIDKQDRSFGGIVFIGLKAEYILKYYEKIDLGKDQLIALTGMDGFNRVRRSDDKFETGQDIRGSEFWKYIQKGYTSKSFLSANVLDGITRIMSYVVLPEYPLIVAIGESTQVALAGYEQRKNGYLLGALLISLFVLVAFGLLVERFERQRKLYLRTRQQVGSMHILQQTTGHLIQQIRNSGELLQVVLQDGLRLIGASNGYIQLLEENGTQGIILYSVGNHGFKVGERISNTVGLQAQVYASGKLAFVEDYQTYPKRLEDERVERLTSAVVAPLLREEQVIGVLSAFWFDSVHHLSETELDTLRQYADTAAIVLYQLQEQERIAQQSQLIDGIFEVAAELLKQLDLQRVLEIILKQVTVMSGTPHAHVSLWEEQRGVMRTISGNGFYADRVGSTYSTDEGSTREVMENGILVFVGDYANWPQRRSGELNDKLTAVVLAPLALDSKIIGVIGLSWFEPSPQVDSEKLVILERFAVFASVALKNAQLFETAQAEITQRSIAEQSLKTAQVKLEKLATTDQLTGAANRRSFESAAKVRMKEAERRRRMLSLLMIDIDHFKRINDHFGHSVGDDVLVDLVRLVEANIRGSDFFARWGGEEFLLMTPDLNAHEATTFAERLRQIIALHEFKIVGRLNVSIGVTEFVASENLKCWVKRADDALYQAKSAGRNNVQVVLGE